MKWLPTGNKFISLFPPNAKKEQHNLESEGDGPSFANSIEDVIDRDLQLIPFVCNEDPLHEDNNKIMEQNLETTNESHSLVQKVIDLLSDVRVHPKF